MSSSGPGRPRPETVPSPLLRVTTRRLPDRALVLTLTGEVTVHRRETLRRALDEAVRMRPSLLIVDLTGIGFCDSTVLNALLRTRIGARVGGFPLVLAGPPPQAMRLLRLTRTDAVFTLRPSVESALATPHPGSGGGMSGLRRP
jgi:anti-sigma B factor antagonist